MPWARPSWAGVALPSHIPRPPLMLDSLDRFLSELHEFPHSVTSIWKASAQQSIVEVVNNAHYQVCLLPGSGLRSGLQRNVGTTKVKVLFRNPLFNTSLVLPQPGAPIEARVRRCQQCSPPHRAAERIQLLGRHAVRQARSVPGARIHSLSDCSGPPAPAGNRAD